MDAHALPTLSVGASLAARSRDLGSAFDFTSNFATIDAALSFNLGGAAAAARRSADARARAAVLGHEALEVTLTAEVARSFVARAALEARLGLLDGSIKDAADLQRIIELRQREGVATKVDVGLQAIRVEQLRAEHDRLEQALDETRVALALLVGAEAPGFRSVPAQIRGFALPSIGLPSPGRLIGDRLDVRAAEARIAAAGGDVATARAAFFPRIDVSLSRSAQAMLASGPLSGITFGADLVAPIFDRHRLRSGLDEAVAVERETIEAYARFARARSPDAPPFHLSPEIVLIATGLIATLIVVGMGFIRPSFSMRYLLPYVGAVSLLILIVVREVKPLLPVAPMLIVMLFIGSAVPPLVQHLRAPEADHRYAFNFEQPSAWIMAQPRAPLADARAPDQFAPRRPAVLGWRRARFRSAKQAEANRAATPIPKVR